MKLLLLAVLLLSAGCGTYQTTQQSSDDTTDVVHTKQWAFNLHNEHDYDFLKDYKTVFMGLGYKQELIDKLVASGTEVIAYISAGSCEDWRDDYDQLKPYCGQDMQGWDEKWLNINQWKKFLPIMKKRIDLVKAKRFTGFYLDNVDVYANVNGVSFDANLEYINTLLDYAKAKGIKAGVNNGLKMLPALAAKVDFTINEQCKEYGECYYYRPIIELKKNIYHVEFQRRYCEKVDGMMTICYRKESLKRKYFWRELQ